MNAFEALRAGDPAAGLVDRQLDPRDELMLHRILDAPVERPTLSTAPQSTPLPSRRSFDLRSVLVTASVAVLLAACAVVALHHAPGPDRDEGGAASSPATRTALTRALFALLPAGASTAPATTWTEASRSASGGPLDTADRSLLLAGACRNGGAITIAVSGRADTTIACARLSTVGPITLRTGTGALSIDVSVTSGHPEYVVKSLALDRTPTRSASPLAAARTCAAHVLSLHATQLEGAAGTDYGFIDITNRSAASCTLRGWPRALLTDRRGGSAIGAPAGRSGRIDAEAVPPITLRANGGRATLRVSIVNIAGYSTGKGTYYRTCGHAVSANGWSITLPGSDRASYVRFASPHRAVCSSTTLRIATISQVVPLTRTQ